MTNSHAQSSNHGHSRNARTTDRDKLFGANKLIKASKALAKVDPVGSYVEAVSDFSMSHLMLSLGFLRSQKAAYHECDIGARIDHPTLARTLFRPMNNHILTFRSGDMFEVLSSEYGGWWKVRVIRSGLEGSVKGSVGLLPFNFVVFSRPTGVDPIADLIWAEKHGLLDGIKSDDLARDLVDVLFAGRAHLLTTYEMLIGNAPGLETFWHDLASKISASGPAFVQHLMSHHTSPTIVKYKFRDIVSYLKSVASEDENTEHLDAFLRGDAEEVRTTFNGHMYSNIHQVISNSLTRSQCKQLRIYSITNTSQTQVQRALEKYEKENANDVDEDVHLTGKGLFDWASQDFSAGGVKDTLESQYVVVFISHSHTHKHSTRYAHFISIETDYMTLDHRYGYIEDIETLRNAIEMERARRQALENILLSSEDVTYETNKDECEGGVCSSSSDNDDSNRSSRSLSGVKSETGGFLSFLLGLIFWHVKNFVWSGVNGVFMCISILISSSQLLTLVAHRDVLDSSSPQDVFRLLIGFVVMVSLITVLPFESLQNAISPVRELLYVVLSRVPSLYFQQP